MELVYKLESSQSPHTSAKAMFFGFAAVFFMPHWKQW